MSTWISTMFHQGGAAMFSIAYLAGPALVFAVIHAIRPRRWLAWVAAGLTAFVLVVGVHGWLDSRGIVDKMLASEEREGRMSRADRDSMREYGYLEAQRPLQFGGLVAGICVVPLGIGELRRRRRA
jgi:hypothetical protein